MEIYDATQFTILKSTFKCTANWIQKVLLNKTFGQSAIPCVHFRQFNFQLILSFLLQQISSIIYDTLIPKWNKCDERSNKIQRQGKSTHSNMPVCRMKSKYFSFLFGVCVCAHRQLIASLSSCMRRTIAMCNIKRKLDIKPFSKIVMIKWCSFQILPPLHIANPKCIYMKWKSGYENTIC